MVKVDVQDEAQPSTSHHPQPDGEVVSNKSTSESEMIVSDSDADILDLNTVDQELDISGDTTDSDVGTQADVEAEASILNSTMQAMQVEREVANADGKMELLFKNHLMEPMTFVLLLHDFPLEVRLTRLVEECGGVVYSSMRDSDRDGFVAVLVKDDSLHWAHRGPVFKVSYLQKCIMANRILNITKYFKASFNIRYTADFNYMAVVYFKKFTWASIPNRFVKTDTTKSIVEKNDDDIVVVEESASTSGVQPIEAETPTMNRPIVKSAHTARKSVNKHTRMLYSRKEDEDILKYIVKKEGYELIKGVIFWKTMEHKDICPHRTWQSMKEHFLKKIAYNLNSFDFLNDKQRKIIQMCAFK